MGGEVEVVAERLSYEDSCRRLWKLGYLAHGEFPPLPARRPSVGDEEPLGLSFYKTGVEEESLEEAIKVQLGLVE